MNNFLCEQSVDLQSKIRKYRRWQDMQASLIGRLLLKEGLKILESNIDYRKVSYNKYQKPYFKDEFIKFNISHSEHIVVCALTKNDDIGIDIECKKEIDLKDFIPQMTNEEINQILSSSSVLESFYDYWTRKEAVIKANGFGLFTPLKSFEIIDNKTRIDDKNYFLYNINLDNNYKCNLALSREKSSSEKIEVKSLLF